MTDQQSSSRPLRYNVFLLGKTGSGKSASRNTLVGKKAFISKKSPRSVTQEIQMEKVTYDGVTLYVYDTPGLFNSEASNDITIRKLESQINDLQLDETARTVFLVVIKADRLGSEDKQAVDLIEQVIPEWLIQNTWILFTRGDDLEREDLTIEEFIEDTEGLTKVTQRFQNKYHIFNNISHNPQQVKDLINKIKEAPVIITPEMGLSRTPALYREVDPLYIVLVGKTGVGKSATGNTILGEKIFRSDLSLSSITLQSEIQHGVVSGRNVSVIDTPGLFDTKQSSEEIAKGIGRSIYLSSPGPHTFLYIQPINTRFTEQEENVVEKLEQIFGRDMKKYTIILFTYGDQLDEMSVQMLIQQNGSLRSLVDRCGGRYHIFNNKDLRNRKQVSELLLKIDRMVEENGGICYSNQMYEESASFRSEEERRTEKTESTWNRLVEVCKIHPGFIGIVAGIRAGIRAVVGAVFGAVFGAGAGAGVGVLVGAGAGAGVGVGAEVVSGMGEGEEEEDMNTEP